MAEKQEGKGPEHCCFMEGGADGTRCAFLAAWVVTSEGNPQEPTYACDKHLSEMLEPGVSHVWPYLGD